MKESSDGETLDNSNKRKWKMEVLWFQIRFLEQQRRKHDVQSRFLSWENPRLAKGTKKMTRLFVKVKR